MCRWPTYMLAVTTLAVGFTLRAEAPLGAAAPPSRLTPLAVDPAGPVSPAEAFQAWRRANRVSLPATPRVLEAQRQWLDARGFTTPATARGAGAEATIANACPAGGVQDYQGEMAIAVNPADPRQMVAGANSFFQDPVPACQAPVNTTYGTMALYGSADGGATWTYNCAPWPSDDTGSVGTAMFGSDPAVAWDAQGVAYASYMLISENTRSGAASASIVVARSADAGASWQPLGVVVNNLGNSSLFDDKDLMAVDATSAGSFSHPDRIYVIWDENNEERVAFSDTGLSGTWTTVVVDPGGDDIGGNVAVGADGTVYAVWNRLLGSGNTQTGENIAFSRSVDGGVTWSAPVVIASPALLSFGTNNVPPAQDARGVNAFASLAVDADPHSPYVNRLYAVYADFPSGVSAGPDLDVELVSSSDGGATWSTPRRVNDDGAGNTQFFPWCAVDPGTGALCVAWYDTRNDPAGRRADVYSTVSGDGGGTFSPDLQLTSPSADFYNSTLSWSDENSQDNANFNANQYGDYMGMTAGGGKATVAWTDSRQAFPLSSASSSLLAEDLAVASAEEAPASCRLYCSAVAPLTGTTGAAVALSATSTPVGCSGSPSFDWDFGDGSAHASHADTAHAYDAPGTYTWTLTTTVLGDTCTKTGSVSIVLPPVVSVKKMGSPFRLVVRGSNLQQGVVVTVNGAPWPSVKWKSTAKVVVAGGGSLKAVLPKGVPNTLVFTNPDGGAATVAFTW